MTFARLPLGGVITNLLGGQWLHCEGGRLVRFDEDAARTAAQGDCSHVDTMFARVVIAILDHDRNSRA